MSDKNKNFLDKSLISLISSEKDLNSLFESRIHKLNYKSLGNYNINFSERTDFYHIVYDRFLKESSAPLDIKKEILVSEGFFDKVDKILDQGADLLANIKTGRKSKIKDPETGKIKTLDRDETLKKAKEDFAKILTSEKNKLLRDLVSKFNKEYPDFPNFKGMKRSETPTKFRLAMADIYVLYDSLVAASKEWEKDNSKGMHPTIVNALIKDLRKMVQFWADHMLNDIGRIVDSHERDQELINEYLFGLLKEEDEGDESSTLTGEKGDLEIWKEIKSLKAPVVLLALGGALGTLGWLAKSSWAKNLVTSIIENGDKFKSKRDLEGFVTNSITSESIGLDVKKGEGLSQIMKRLIDPSINPNTTGAEMIQMMEKVGAEPETFSKLTAEPDQWLNWFNEKMAAGSQKPLSELFGKDPGPPGIGFRVGKTVTSQIAKKTVEIIFKETAKSVGPGAAVATGLGSLAVASGLASTLGIGVAAGGLAVFLARLKGKNRSRAKQLQDLYNELEYISEPEETKPLSTTAGEVKTSSASGGTEDGGTEDGRTAGGSTGGTEDGGSTGGTEDGGTTGGTEDGGTEARSIYIDPNEWTKLWQSSEIMRKFPGMDIKTRQAYSGYISKWLKDKGVSFSKPTNNEGYLLKLRPEFGRKEILNYLDSQSLKESINYTKINNQQLQELYLYKIIKEMLKINFDTFQSNNNLMNENYEIDQFKRWQILAGVRK